MRTVMTKVSLTEARKDLPDVVNRVHYKRERIAISKHRKAVAFLISVEDFEAFEALEDFFLGLRAKEELAKAAARGEKPRSLKKLKEELGR
jgi:prevent-host-death family protein